MKKLPEGVETQRLWGGVFDGLLQKQHTVVKIFRICLTRRINLNSLWPQQDGSTLGKRRFGQLFSGAVAVVAVALLAACAAVNPRSSEDIVKERAQARWNALVQGDVKSAYEYFSPGSRATQSLSDYASGIKIGFWKAVTVDRVQCGGESCEVHSTIEYEHRGMRVKTPHRETWVREGSNWWYLRR